MKRLCCIAFAMAAVAGTYAAETLAELPVSATANAVYLTAMKDRPWWNKAWKRRAPLLVSSQAKVACGKAIVDCVVDFGEGVKPEDVRVVTPWETLVPCTAEKVKVEGEGEQRKIRLLFLTPLRIEENKPFLVYWNRQGGDALATKTTFFSPLLMRVTGEDIRIQNGVLDVTFDNLHRTPGFIKRIHVNASQTPNELLHRATGYAWAGFTARSQGDGPWSPAEIVADNAFKKQIRFTNNVMTVDFAIYADQPRIDWSYTLTGWSEGAWIGVSWACGDGTGLDDFYYRGISGKVLSFRASLDHCTDCIPNPAYEGLARWFGEGWYAIRDRERRETVGMIFDRDSLAGFDYEGAGQYAGERTSIRFVHAKKPSGPRPSGRGALVATLGDVAEVADEYARWMKPPRVFVGAAESYREIPVRRPRIDHDFCADFNIGQGPGAGWESGDPLEGTDWCSNIVDRIRSYGANAVRIGGYGWRDMAVGKDLYDRIQSVENPKVEGKEHKPSPDWKAADFTGRKFREHVEAAHAKGVSVSLWTGFLPGVRNVKGGHEAMWDDALCALDVELQSLYADLGADIIYNARACREAPDTPAKLQNENGSSACWTWKDPRPYFDWENKRTEQIKTFYRESKKRHPDVPVVLMNSEASIRDRETMMTDQAGFIDTVYCEIMPLNDSPNTVAHTKHVAKRLRALFDNEAGRTVYHHYFYYSHETRQRILNSELPFVFGVNGFTFENLTYENFGLEQTQLTADFFRFLEYTKLGEKVAKMGSVKDVAVYRDNKAFVDDNVKKRPSAPYEYMTPQDGRANAFADIRNFNYDIVIDPFFTAKALAKYRVVYVPEDEAFSEQDAKELLAFVKAGGSAVVEGRTGEKVKSKVEVEERNSSTLRLGLGTSTLSLDDDVITPYGKGKIVWVKEVLTDQMAKGEWEGGATMGRVKKLLADLGSVQPYELNAKSLDSMLQASDEGLFLGVYNKGSKRDSGRVTLGERTLLSVRGLTRGKGVPALADGKSDPPRQGEDALATKSGAANRQGEDALATTKTLFVLDVKKGVRFAYTNGFDVTVGPEQSAFFLIGDEKFTAIPAVREGVWTGAAADATDPKGVARGTNPDPDFRPCAAVELLSAAPRNYQGVPSFLRRTEEAAIERRTFVADEAHLASDYGVKDFDAWQAENPKLRPFGAAAFARALKTASYLHVNVKPEESDVAFAACGAELKDFLKRGGGILFDRCVTGPAARKFFAEVGVFDPCAHLVPTDGYGNPVFNKSFPKEHPYYATNKTDPGWHGNSYTSPLEHDGGGWSRVFSKWDASKQLAPFVGSQNAAGAMLVVQDKVLGAGKVAFSQNGRAFNDWYESKTYGNVLLSWMIGMPVFEHEDRVRKLNGGVGDVVK